MDCEGLLETFFSSCLATGGDINKVLNNAPENAGDKLKQKKARRGKINISKGSMTTIQDQPEPKLLILKLIFQRETVYRILP